MRQSKTNQGSPPAETTEPASPASADTRNESAPTRHVPGHKAAAPEAATTVTHSRAGTVWVGLIAVAIVVVALVVFIAQNSQKVTIHFVGFHGHASLALALLVATVGGILLVAIPGSTRILQLRRTVRKQSRS